MFDIALLHYYASMTIAIKAHLLASMLIVERFLVERFLFLQNCQKVPEYGVQMV